MTFTAVNKTQLQQAFALAHRAGEDDKCPKIHRAKFQQIARLIWRAHGEQGSNPPDGCGAELIARTSLMKEAE